MAAHLCEVTYMNIREYAIRKPETWQGALGLLPVMLFPEETSERFVLLNGASGNFCLNATYHEVEPKERAGHAWSCNVGHYLLLRDNFIEVSRWDQAEKVQRYTISSVIDNLPQFHSFLEKESPDAQTNISSHYNRAFRRLRSLWNAPGEDAINAFLYLVACASSDKSELPAEKLSAWDISPAAKDRALELQPSDRESIIEQLAGVGSYKSLRPELSLMVRHASGAVFEESHRVAAAPSGQLWLDGFINEARITGESESMGVHFTPSSIARTLAEEAIANLNLNQQEILAFDPTCGSAELLKELVRMLEKTAFNGVLKLKGRDISPAAVAMARFTLAFECRVNRKFRLEYDIQQGDSLEIDWPGKCSVIIMNPPFRRWNDLPDEQKGQMANILGVISTRANYANAFFHRALDRLADGGVLAAVAPKAIFETAASAATRGALAERLAPRLIARLGSQTLFKGSLVDAGLYVGVMGGTRSPALSLWADQSPRAAPAALRALRRRFVMGEVPAEDKSYSIYPDPQIGTSDKAWTARSNFALQNWAIATKNGKLVKASTYFDIKQGARMGDDVFVVEKSYVSGLPKSEQSFFRPAVLNSSVQDGKLNDRFFVFYPHTTGLPSLNSEADLIANVGTYAEQYLLPKKEKLQRRKFKAPNPNWWEMIWPRTWQFEKQPKLVSKYFGGAGSFAWDHTGEYVVVVGHAWIQDPDVALRQDLISQYSIVTTVYLNLPETEELIDYLSVRVSGGQLDLSSRYLKQLLIPSPRKLDESVLAKVSALGALDAIDQDAQAFLRAQLGL